MNENSWSVAGRFITVGDSFGRLTVIKLFRQESRLVAEAECQCGRTIITRAYHLVTNRSTSCGCTRAALTASVNAIKRRKAYGWASMINLFNTYRSTARRKNVEFSLTRDLFSVLTKQRCRYCGKEPNNVHQPERCYGEYVYNGLDRKNNELGYTPENAVPACYTCNRAKGTLSEEEFLAWIFSVTAKHYEQYRFSTTANDIHCGLLQP